MTAPDDQRNGPVRQDNSYESAVKSIEEAEKTLAKIEEKVRDSQEKKNQVLSKAGDVVKVLLEPASLVAIVLNTLGNTFSPCGIAGTALQALVDMESKRRDNDVKIAFIHLDMARTLVTLGTLKLGSEAVPALVSQLSDLITRVCATMKSFGEFSQSFYDGKKVILKHLVYSKRNKDKLEEFHDDLNKHRGDIDTLLNQQILMITISNTDALMGNAASLKRNSDTLLRLDSKLEEMYEFVVFARSAKENKAINLVEQYGGEDVVLGDGGILREVASHLDVEFSESICRAVKEDVREASRQNRELFSLMFEFTRKQIEDSKQVILKDLKEGPYELVENDVMKEIWKEIAAKESSIKRRRLIDALVYHFTVQFRQYKIANGIDKEDAWTRTIISKVHYHPSIGDAIDDDASGYISVEELNDFMRKKPEKWSVPEWIAYWAYGWDADNIYYQDKIDKAYRKLEDLCAGNHCNADFISHYLEKTKEPLTVISRSVYTMDDLDASAERKMSRLRADWRDQSEKTIKAGLKSAGYEIDYLSVSAICGSDRVEVTFIPLVALLLSRHVSVLSDQEKALDEEDAEDMLGSMENLVEVVKTRITDLRRIWRRQRIDVDTQMRYYANGLFEDYYKKSRSDFETGNEDGDYSEWDSEDEWDSDDDAASAVTGSAQPEPSAPPEQTSANELDPREQWYGRGRGNQSEEQGQGPDTQEPEQQQQEPEQQWERDRPQQEPYQSLDQEPDQSQQDPDWQLQQEPDWQSQQEPDQSQQEPDWQSQEEPDQSQQGLEQWQGEPE
ncbi:hypothetical protein M0805_008381 [Coniferiporia weirii]|nr:hypothetical protein M0805_008381 [Coniferiporia weirii]